MADLYPVYMDIGGVRKKCTAYMDIDGVRTLISTATSQETAEPIINTYNYQDFEEATVFDGTGSAKYAAGSIPISGAREYTYTDSSDAPLIRASYTHKTLYPNPIVRNGDTIQALLCLPNIDTSLTNVKIYCGVTFVSSIGTWLGMNIEYDVTTQTYSDVPASNANLYYSDLQFHETVVDGVKYIVVSFVPILGDFSGNVGGFHYDISGTLQDGSSGETVEWSFPVDNPVTLEVTCNHVTSIETDEEVYVGLGESVQLSATVYGVGTYDNSVTWAKSNALQSNITITTDGLITIPESATWTSRKVRVKSVQNPEIYVDVTVYLKTSE